jgi:hypothetical protein
VSDAASPAHGIERKGGLAQERRGERGRFALFSPRSSHRSLVLLSPSSLLRHALFARRGLLVRDKEKAPLEALSAFLTLSLETSKRERRERGREREEEEMKK